MKTENTSRAQMFLRGMLFALYSGLLYVLQEFRGVTRLVVGMVASAFAGIILYWLLEIRRSQRER